MAVMLLRPPGGHRRGTGARLWQILCVSSDGGNSPRGESGRLRAARDHVQDQGRAPGWPEEEPVVVPYPGLPTDAVREDRPGGQARVFGLFQKQPEGAATAPSGPGAEFAEGALEVPCELQAREPGQLVPLLHGAADSAPGRIAGLQGVQVFPELGGAPDLLGPSRLHVPGGLR